MLKKIAFFLVLFIFARSKVFCQVDSVITSNDVYVKSIKDSLINWNQLVKGSELSLIVFGSSFNAPFRHEINTIGANLGKWNDSVKFSCVFVFYDKRSKSESVYKAWSQKGDFVFSNEDDNIIRYLGIQSIPTTFIVNNRGEILWRHPGGFSDEEDQIFKKLIEFQNAAKRH